MKKILAEILTIVLIALAFLLPPWQTAYHVGQHSWYASEWAFFLNPPNSILSSIDISLLGLELLAICIVYLLIKPIFRMYFSDIQT